MVGRVRGILGVNKYKIVEVLALANAMKAAMGTKQTVYLAPNPSLDILGNQIEDLEAAQLLVRNRAPGAAAARDEKRNVLWTSMENERMYVQTLADAAGSPEQARTIILGAALMVANVPVRPTSALVAELGQQPGSVDLVAHVRHLVNKVRGRRYFNWEFTVNGGQSWSAAPTTPLAETTIMGLPRLTVCGFRVSVSDPSGQSDWSPIVSILVH